MRKILIMLLIIILLVAFGIMVTSGIQIGNFEIPAVKKIIEKNEQLDIDIAELSASIENDYASAQTSLAQSENKLQTAKQSYQDTIKYSTEEEIKAANQTEKYKIDFLWTQIGLYSTKNNITMQANVSPANIEDLYNISFTATGEYIPISEFVYAIENDSKLGFRIEEFRVVPYSENELQATFIIRNVAINEDSLIAAGASIPQSDNNNQNNTTNNQQANTITDENTVLE